MLHAQSVSMLANVNRDSKKRPAPYRIDDFMLFKEREQKAESSGGVLLADPDAQTELMIAAMFGGMNVIRAD
jgi:hypothetical protein